MQQATNNVYLGYGSHHLNEGNMGLPVPDIIGATGGLHSFTGAGPGPFPHHARVGSGAGHISPMPPPPNTGGVSSLAFTPITNTSSAPPSLAPRSNNRNNVDSSSRLPSNPSSHSGYGVDDINESNGSHSPSPPPPHSDVVDGDPVRTKRRDWLVRMNRRLQETPVGKLDPQAIPINAVMNAWAKTKSAEGAAMVEMWLDRVREEQLQDNIAVQLTTKMYTMVSKLPSFFHFHYRNRLFHFFISILFFSFPSHLGCRRLGKKWRKRCCQQS